jgi:anti-sigma regulatory factor (Ser/Thr protein kinase)
VVSTVFAAVDAAGGGPDADARDELISALGEAFNNVVLHAYRDVRGGTIDVRVTATSSSVEVAVSDRGRSFDPAAVPGYVAPQMDHEGALDDVDLDRLPEGGMGLFIMRSFMDEVTYVAGGGGRPNVLVLRKTWPGAHGAPPLSMGPQAAPNPGVRARDEALDTSGNAVRSVLVEDLRDAPERSTKHPAIHLIQEAISRASVSKKESSRSGWRMRSVAVPSYEKSTAGSLKRK